MNTTSAPVGDSWLWLEEVEGERALAWVRERNAQTEARLEADPAFEPVRDAIREVLDSKEQIPHVVRRGPHLYNFWRDETHPRGLWRRTALESYRQPQPAWDVLLDLDALAAAEAENWVWAGATVLGPAYRHALVQLSRGGADATVVREFDLDERRFVEGGFAVPEAKTRVTWLDEDTVFVGTDFGPGSLTDSGYPRTIRRWRRGSALADAPTVFEGEPTDVSVGVLVDRTPGFERIAFSRATDFYTERVFLLEAGALREVDKPADAELHFWRERLLLRLRSDWPVAGAIHAAGSLLAADARAYLERGERTFETLFTPTPSRSLGGFDVTRRCVLLAVLDDVAGRLEVLAPSAAGWQRLERPTPGSGSLSVSSLHDPLAADDALAEAFLLHYTDFLTPDSLLLGTTPDATLEPLKSRPSFFEGADLVVEQRFATSRDGTRVPCFVVGRRGQHGPRPTLLYGYGGFEVSLEPFYSGEIGRSWLARGGVFVLANIRGGGEYGPAWHQSAILAHKQRSYDDFAAVAEHLIAWGLTEPARLAIQGGSNGGLLVGAVMLQRPELFAAVVCQVPLLDMQRYHRLLAGASWMAEYGNPDDPADWAVIERYSPYQRLAALPAGTRLPSVLLTTSTRDDRVHPGHARKMAARLSEFGHRVLYWENIEGGHGGAADNAQAARMKALAYTFLWQALSGT
jgi:prolyl oligopeptidase